MLGKGDDIWSYYTKEEGVGRGVYGKVYKAKCKRTGNIFAIKATPTDAEGILPTTIREVCLLKQLNHPNIVS